MGRISQASSCSLVDWSVILGLLSIVLCYTVYICKVHWEVFVSQLTRTVEDKTSMCL